MNKKENKLKFSLNGITPVLDFLHARIVQRSRKTATPHFVFGTPFLQTNCSGLCDRSPSSLIGSVGSIFSLPGLAIAPSVRKSATRGSKPHSSATATTLPLNERVNAFTLAEVLITLGVIGVVAAVTMPTLVTNIQERVRKEQVRTVKYKLTKATDKMKSLGKIGPYDSPATKNFVNELKKHMTIAKVCDSGNLSECWSSETVNIHTSQTTITPTSINSLAKGTGLKALAIGSGGEDTVGIVTGDGVPMLLVYSPKCQALDETKTYTWSVDDGKPVTNATTNCISAIFDINGAKGPNRVGQDIRTLNSLFGSIDLGPVSISQSECNSIKSKYGIKECGVETDYWAGGMKKCADIGLHLPDMMTLANIANSRYGTTKIGIYTMYLGSTYGSDCIQQIHVWDSDPYRITDSDAILCNEDTNTDPNSGLNVENTADSSIDGFYWGNVELSDVWAYRRGFYANFSDWGKSNRSLSNRKSLCVGD